MNAAAAEGPTRDELYEKAQDLDIEGRSEMNKDELQAALEQAEGGGGSDPARSPLRAEPGATTPKTGPVPPATVEGQTALTGGVPVPESDRRFGLPRNASVSRVRDRRKERIAAAREAAES